LVERGLDEPRAAYAHAAARDIVVRAEALVEAWDPAGADFSAELAGAGSDGNAYATVQDALNAVSDALFYLDTETKDMKLAEPLGVMDCGNEVCLTESRF